MKRSKRWFVAAATVIALGWYALALAGKTRQTDEAMRAAQAASVLEEIMEAPDLGIPEDLLDTPTSK